MFRAGSRFRDRRDAGRQLADRLRREQLSSPVVLGLPRGGVPVAWEVAAALDAPLDVLVVRKVGVPAQPELGMGAVAEGGVDVVDDTTVAMLRIADAALERALARAREEVAHGVQAFRQGRPLGDVRGRDVVVVDDGLATGLTALAAALAVRARDPQRVVLAVPVCAPQVSPRLSAEADVVCVRTPGQFGAVGLWYDDFTQTTDDEARDLLAHRWT